MGVRPRWWETTFPGGGESTEASTFHMPEEHNSCSGSHVEHSEGECSLGTRTWDSEPAQEAPLGSSLTDHVISLCLSFLCCAKETPLVETA
jgi:hypothetical protein